MQWLQQVSHLFHYLYFNILQSDTEIKDIYSVRGERLQGNRGKNNLQTYIWLLQTPNRPVLDIWKVFSLGIFNIHFLIYWGFNFKYQATSLLFPYFFTDIQNINKIQNPVEQIFVINMSQNKTTHLNLALLFTFCCWKIGNFVFLHMAHFLHKIVKW